MFRSVLDNRRNNHDSFGGYNIELHIDNLRLNHPPRREAVPRADDRLIFEGILWILKAGARWKGLLDKYPHP